MKRALTLILVLGLSSCVYHKGMMIGTVDLGKSYEVVGFASGSATVTRPFGLGGTKKEGLINAARREMATTFPLEKGQAYANLTVDFQNSFFLLFTKSRVIVSSEIIQESGAVPFSQGVYEGKSPTAGSAIVFKINGDDRAFIVRKILSSGLVSAYNSETKFILLDPKYSTNVFSVGDMVSFNLGDVVEKGMITLLSGDTAIIRVSSDGRLQGIKFNTISKIE